MPAKRTKKKERGPLAGPRRKRNVESYGRYTYRVLKQVHPDTGISKRAMGIMNSFLNDVFERLASEAGGLCRYNKKATTTFLRKYVIEVAVPHRNSA